MKLNIATPKPQTLEEIFENDEFGLFSDIKAKKVKPEHQTLFNNFREIEDFVEKYQREPSNQGNITEKQLARRLANLRNDPEKCKILLDFDRLQLLQAKKIDAENVREPKNLAEVFEADPFGLLDIGNTDILNLVHIQPQSKISRYEGEVVGSRSECLDFERYQPVFSLLHQLLKDKSIITEKQKTENIEKGDCFILQGLLACVVDKNEEDRQSDRKNFRLRIIFENGTESNMLSRSLSVALYKDEMSKRIMFADEANRNRYFNLLFGKRTGYIYVVKLKTPKIELKHYLHLYKIGFTSTSVKERIKNSKNDIAFLESDVIPVVTFECYELNPHKLEILLHEFFYAQRLQLTLISKNGSSYQPQEWFNVELESIETTIEKLLQGTINEYRMDNTTGRIIRK